MRKFDVVSFGSAVRDVFVDTDVSERGDFISYPVGSKILIRDLKFDVGGGGTNSAVAFSRLGLKAGFVGSVGNDENGKEIQELLKKERVKFLGKVAREKSSYSIILDSRGGERTILSFKGPANNVKISDVPKFESDWLYFSSVLGKSFGTQVELAERMKKSGTKLAFNPSDYLIKELDVRRLLRLSDVVVLNREEFDLVEKRFGKSLLEICSGVVVVTDKNKIITCFADGKKYFLKPHKIKVVERTGAGDAFASGFVAGYVMGWGIDRCLKLGLEESESVIRFFGAKNNLLRRNIKGK